MSAIDVQLHPPRPPSRWRGPLVGAGVFAALLAGWLGSLAWRAAVEARSPLPDSGGPQGRCAVWFVGSSSVSRWPALAGRMRPWLAHNRGVGGASIRQILPRFANEAGVAAPSAIVFYGGDNDIARGESVTAALGDVAGFLSVKDRRFGRVPALLLSVKYSPARWHFRGAIDGFNAGLRRFAARRGDTFYVDVSSGLLVRGRPGPFFEGDGIHIVPAAYGRWDGEVLSALARDVPDASACASGRGARP